MAPESGNVGAGHGPRLGTRGLGGRRGPCRSPVQQTARSNNCRFSDRRYCDMMADVPDDETIALRATVIDGNGYPHDYQVVWARPVDRQDERYPLADAFPAAGVENDHLHAT